MARTRSLKLELQKTFHDFFGFLERLGIKGSISDARPSHPAQSRRPTETVATLPGMRTLPKYAPLASRCSSAS